MGTTEKLRDIKQLLATSFMHATENSIATGLAFAFKSYSETQDEDTFWCVDIIVKEAGYGERVIQQFKYGKPNNITINRMEYQVLLEVLSYLVQGALITWYEAAKYLATDKELQKEIIDEAKKDNIPSF